MVIRQLLDELAGIAGSLGAEAKGLEAAGLARAAAGVRGGQARVEGLRLHLLSACRDESGKRRAPARAA